jgi:hypothetical protein
MHDILIQAYEAIKQWPVLLQGVAGSALFAGLSFLGKVSTKKVVTYLAKANKTLRKDNLFRELFHKKFIRLPEMTDRILILSIFQALSYAASGLIFLAIGWLFDGLIPLSLKIGLLGFLYYIFRAALWLDRLTVESKETDLQIWERVKEIETELDGAPAKDTLEKLKTLKP